MLSFLLYMKKPVAFKIFNYLRFPCMYLVSVYIGISNLQFEMHMWQSLFSYFEMSSNYLLLLILKFNYTTKASLNELFPSLAPTEWKK